MRSDAVAWLRPDRKLTTGVDAAGKFIFRVDDAFLPSETFSVTIDLFAARCFGDVHIGTVCILISNLFPVPPPPSLFSAPFPSPLASSLPPSHRFRSAMAVFDLQDDSTAPFDLQPLKIKLSDYPTPARQAPERRAPPKISELSFSDSDSDVDEDEDDDEGIALEYGESGTIFHGGDFVEDDEETEEGEEERKEKEKGVPVVMHCFDWAKIYVKAGDGGSRTEPWAGAEPWEPWAGRIHGQGRSHERGRIRRN